MENKVNKRDKTKKEFDPKNYKVKTHFMFLFLALKT